MQIGYHPRVGNDVAEIVRHYENISFKLADEFERELGTIIRKAAANPLRFHLVDRGFRRANMDRFPYHILYEVHANVLRVMIVRHNRRHPSYGLSRK